MLSVKEKKMMMLAKKKAEKMVCNEMPYIESHHLCVNNNSSMLMGFSANGASSSSPRLSPFDEARMMHMHDVGSEFMNKANEKKMLDEFIELGLAKNVHGMHIGEEIESFGNQEAFGYGFDGHFLDEKGRFNNGSVYDYERFEESLKNGFSLGQVFDNKCCNVMHREIREPPCYNDYCGYCGEGFEMQRPCMMRNRPVLDDGFHSSEQFAMNSNGDIGLMNPLLYNTQVMMNGVNQSILSMENKGAVEAFGCEDKFIIQGKGVNCVVVEKKNGHKKNQKSREKKAALHCQSPFEGITGNSEFGLQQNSLMDPICSSLAVLQCSYDIYLMAKEQLGCRLLQRLIDEGTYQDVELIFKGVIDHVSQLMMEPFGNYLVQKFLDVCNEGQRTQVVFMVTKKPGELIKISKNVYGTRVVQKLIETVKTRQQISLVTQALEPGFLDLVNDLNGNHVVQRCLQCLTEEQNKFIFDGAARFCVEVAIDCHGCCVLNHCIAHSSGRLREKLVAEVCANALLLAQDAFGNYVVQHIIERKIPSAAVALLNEFKGHFVHLSMQKFSSHVVEQCLKCYEQSRPRIVHELLSAPQFDQLLQHPFANYVIQSALQVTKGPLRVLLVHAVRPYKLLRTSPYCKRIFTKNLLKK